MEKMQETLEEILTRFSTMSSEVKAVSEEVLSLHKQVGDFGDDLYSIKRRVHNTGKSASSPSVAAQPTPPQADKGTGAPRLVNSGAPLLGTPQQQPQGFHTAPSSSHELETSPNQIEREEYSPRQPRHDFPRFHGETPLLWIDQCLTYFEMYHVLEHHWVSTATLYLDGLAALWFQAYKRLHRLINSDDFTGAVVNEFGQDEYDGQMNKLLQLKQTSSVVEYKAQFEECMYHLLSLDPALSTRWFVTQFAFDCEMIYGARFVCRHPAVLLGLQLWQKFRRKNLNTIDLAPDHQHRPSILQLPLESQLTHKCFALIGLSGKAMTISTGKDSYEILGVLMDSVSNAGINTHRSINANDQVNYSPLRSESLVKYCLMMQLRH